MLQISLKAARVNAGMTQEDVIKTLKISKNTLINWEKGNMLPRVDMMQELCALYQVPIDNIFIPKKYT